jgi:hypothetical protein
MVAIAGLVALAGYQLLYYGLTQVQGGQAGFFSLLVPGKYAGNQTDSATAAAAASTPTSVASGVANIATNSGGGGLATAASPIFGAIDGVVAGIKKIFG